MRRVVITGLGVISPLGIGTEPFWSGIAQGRSAVNRINLFDTTGFPVTIAGEVKDFEPKRFIEQKKALKVMARDIQLAVGAARLGMEDSGIDITKIDPTRLGISLGASLISMSIEELSPSVRSSLTETGQFDIAKFGADGMNLLFPLWMLKYLPNMPACHISIMYNAQGPNNTLTTACTASAQAVGEGLKVIQRGDADIMITGGGDSKVNPLNLLRYYFSNCLSTSAREPHQVSRPFDKERDGFVLGEGAGIVVLEELEHAKKRDARIYAELVGYGVASDAAGILGQDFNGRGLVYSMESALEDAQVSKDAIEYISANGLSTKSADRVETAAVKQVFGDRAYDIPMSSIKSMVGHLSSAAGVIQLASAILSMRHRVITPTINYDTPDPECDLDYVPNASRQEAFKTALVNSFGMGGHTASLIIKKFE